MRAVPFFVGFLSYDFLLFVENDAKTGNTAFKICLKINLHFSKKYVKIYIWKK